MAAGGDASSCPACLDTYENPKLLPCLHTFCLKCLQRCPVKNSTISCPVCRTSHSIPSINSLNDFPNDLTVPCSTKTVDKKCQLCVEKNPAISQCNECQSVLCSKCVDLHKTLIPFQQHHIRPIEDNESFYKTLLCIKHNLQPRMFYCLSCHALLCAYCIVFDHRDHDISKDLKEAYACEQQMLSVSHGASVQKLSHYENCLQSLEKFEVSLEKHFETLKASIETDAKHFIDEVNHQKDLLVHQIDEINTKIKKQLWTARNAKEFDLASIQTAIDFKNKIAQCHQNVYLSLTSQLHERFQTITDLPMDKETIKEIASQIPLFSRSAEPQEISKALKSVLPAIVNVYDSFVFTVNIPPKVQPGKVFNATFSISNPTIDLEMLLMPLETDVVIKYGKASDRTLGTTAIHWTSPFQGHVRFSPVCGGAHQVLLKFGDIDVKTHPFFVGQGDIEYTKVRKGPDWVYGDQLVPKGSTGTITRKIEDNYVQVRWNNGVSEKYRWGVENSYDVEIILSKHILTCDTNT